MSLEDRIDELYQAPLAQFTASRNALAKSLSKTEAARVRKLTKPTVVPWGINQLYWKARPAWDRLFRSGEKLRAAQLAALKGGRADVRAAADAHRHAVSDAAKAAERAAAQAGAKVPADAMMRALEALSLMKDPPTHPGRLTEAPQPAGFEALTGVPIKPPARVVRLKPETPGTDDGDDPIRVHADRDRRAERERRQRAADIRKAETAVAHAKTLADRAREAAERAQRSLSDAEAKLAEAEARLARAKQAAVLR